jgi:hypothetical protein
MADECVVVVICGGSGGGGGGDGFVGGGVFEIEGPRISKTPVAAFLQRGGFGPLRRWHALKELPLDRHGHGDRFSHPCFDSNDIESILIMLSLMALQLQL